jgi:type I restriction enzyme M protein
VKANVLFFDRKPIQEKPRTNKLCICDLRANKPFILKETTLNNTDLEAALEQFAIVAEDLKR